MHHCRNMHVSGLSGERIARRACCPQEALYRSCYCLRILGGGLMSGVEYLDQRVGNPDRHAERLLQRKLHVVETVQDQHREFQLANAIEEVKSAHRREAPHDDLTRRGLCLCDVAGRLQPVDIRA
jgi:hypothetical protein